MFFCNELKKSTICFVHIVIEKLHFFEKVRSFYFVLVDNKKIFTENVVPIRDFFFTDIIIISFAYSASFTFWHRNKLNKPNPKNFLSLDVV